MYTIVYKSKAKDDFSNDEIRRMLIKAKIENRKNKITGCLIHHNNRFIQIFEGEEQNVQSLFDRIKNDNRHSEIETIIEKQSDERMWDDWSMAFYDLSDHDNGYEFKRLLLNNHLDLAKPKEKDIHILKKFKEEAELILS